MKSVTTPKGTTLPLTNLKGKDYLMVAYRIQWMNEEVANFTINSEFLLVNDEQTIARSTVSILDKDGKLIKSATATKRETKKDFPDHTEKAETSSIGRALALLGFGTQFAVADLDEGNRLADSPVVALEKAQPIPGVMSANVVEHSKDSPENKGPIVFEPKKDKSSFRKTAVKAAPAPVAVEEEWG